MDRNPIKKYRSTFLFSALVIVAAFLFTACAAPRQADIEHVVLVWLKHPGNAEDRAKLIHATENLQRATGLIRSLKTGTPVPNQRPEVDDSFDLALSMRFDNREKLEAFENNPDHIKAREKILRPLVRRIVIYDIALDEGS